MGRSSMELAAAPGAPSRVAAVRSASSARGAAAVGRGRVPPRGGGAAARNVLRSLPVEVTSIP